MLPYHALDNLSPTMRKKFEAIGSYDPYQGLLVELNQSFHNSYNALIHETHQTLGEHGRPVIVLMRDHVTLFQNGGVEAAVIIPDLYHRLKAISHVSFGVFVTLANNGYGPLHEDNREDLERKRDLIIRTLAILDQEPIPAQFMDLQRLTLENALGILEATLRSGTVEQEAVRAFGEANAPLYLENAAISVGLELDVLHEVVGRWREAMEPGEWDKLHVVICAAHQARYREATKQYFLRLLGERESSGAGQEDRVIYGEHITELDAALDLLARHLVDRRASVELFNSRTRLQRDLMADAATAYLDELFRS